MGETGSGRYSTICHRRVYYNILQARDRKHNDRVRCVLTATEFLKSRRPYNYNFKKIKKSLVTVVLHVTHTWGSWHCHSTLQLLPSQYSFIKDFWLLTTLTWLPSHLLSKSLGIEGKLSIDCKQTKYCTYNLPPLCHIALL